MFNYIVPYVTVTLIQVRWLFLKDLDVRHIDVTDVTTISCVLLPPMAAVFFGKKTGATSCHPTNSKIPAPTKPRQHDTHVRVYRRHVAATTRVAQQEYIEKRTVLHAGLKITAPQPQTMMRPVLWAPTTTMTTPAMTSYVVKLPMVCASTKSIMASTTDCAKNMTGTP